MNTVARLLQLRIIFQRCVHVQFGPEEDYEARKITRLQISIWTKIYKKNRILPRPNRLWGPPSLLSNGYRRLLPWG